MGDIDVSNEGKFCHRNGFEICGTGKPENLTILFKQKTKSEYNKLNDNGYLYESQYTSNHDINYSTWTSDIVFNWWFSPGSQLSLVWKNGIDNTENYITNHWIENLNNSFKLEQQNSVSLKIIYYLDYLYFKNDKS